MNLLENAQKMKSQTFGVEIEMGKISKELVAKIICDYYNQKCGCNNQPHYHGGYYEEWHAYDNQGRNWKCMNDGSSSGRLGHITCEMVTPIMFYEDIEDLQQITRILRQNGARSGNDYNAGVHIHIGANFDEVGGQNATTIRHLVNVVANHEKLINKAVSVTDSRHQRWAQDVERNFLRKLNEEKPTTKKGLGSIWYGSESYYNSIIRDPHGNHYDSSRYHLLNLHALFTKGTIEFRCFEFKRGLHAGELKAWIQLCMAMCSYAKMITRSKYAPIDMANEKYAMKNWLNNLGLVGDEFKTARIVFEKRLMGDCAAKSGRSYGDLDNLIYSQSYAGMNE